MEFRGALEVAEHERVLDFGTAQQRAPAAKTSASVPRSSSSRRRRPTASSAFL
jgi:hypothetical protein